MLAVYGYDQVIKLAELIKNMMSQCRHTGQLRQKYYIILQLHKGNINPLLSDNNSVSAVTAEKTINNISHVVTMSFLIYSY